MFTADETQNAELRGRGFKTNNLCIIKIYVKTETFESRSVTPDPLQRDVNKLLLFLF
jgi:hypothetical protein